MKKRIKFVERFAHLVFITAISTSRTTTFENVFFVLKQKIPFWFKTLKNVIEQKPKLLCVMAQSAKLDLDIH